MIYEGSYLDLVKYGLRLWEVEIVDEMATFGIIFQIDQDRLPPAYNNEASKLRLPSFGFDSATRLAY